MDETRKNEYLGQLEALLAEFSSFACTNERKREIEITLKQFVHMNDAWQYCLFFLKATQDEQTKFFCLNCLETVINKQWHMADSSVKFTIKREVKQYMLENHSRESNSIRNKLVKLVVDMGRNDWPHFDRDFFNEILQLTRHGETALLGVILLTTVSEELATPRADQYSFRKKELHKLLAEQVPEVLALLNGILESVLEKNSHLVAATPPPSPTQQPKNARRTPASLFSSSPIRQETLLSSMFHSPVGGTHMEALPPLDADSKLLCSAALKCISHYFSWAPISYALTPRLMATIFKYAAFGCQGKSARLGASFTPGEQSVLNLGETAMDCINELMLKNYVSPESKESLLQMFQQTFSLLSRLTKESSTSPTGNRLEEIQEGYMDRFTDFLKYFVGVHLNRFEPNPDFYTIDFLNLLYKYTFLQPHADGFFNCLDIWITFLDYLKVRLLDRTVDKDALLKKYHMPLKDLVTNVLAKFMFRNNQSQLEEIDDDSTEDGESEWQSFLRQCLEVVAKVAELLTEDTFVLIWKDFEDLRLKYCSLGEQVTQGSDGCRHLPMTSAEHECRTLHCQLRDLASVLQALGRLADHFIGQVFMDRSNTAAVLVAGLVQVVEYGSKNKLFEVSTVNANVLQQDFVLVHAQAMAAVKAYSHWLLQLSQAAERNNSTQEQENFKLMIVTLIDAIRPLINKRVPEKVVHSAAHLLVSIMTTVRPAFLSQVSAVTGMYEAAAQGACQGLSIEVQLLVYRSLSHFLLLPWFTTIPGGNEQNWADRGAFHKTFTTELAKVYINFNNDPQQLLHAREEDKKVVKRVLLICQDWIDSVAGEVVKSKELLFQSLSQSGIIQTTLNLFSVCIQQPDLVDDIMGFFLSLFRGLRVQMGAEFAANTLDSFMNLFAKFHLAETIKKDAAGVRMVEKFLQLLQLIVEEPGKAFKKFLLRIIEICMDQIWPIVSEVDSPDIKMPMFELVHCLMVNNWRFFFRTTVLDTLQNKEEKVEHGDKFQQIMEAYLATLQQPCIVVFRQNLQSLETLHFKWKLYNKELFQSAVLWRLLGLLLATLVHKSQDLHKEEMLVAVYNLAMVDPSTFTAAFLPRFLQDLPNLLPEQRTTLHLHFKLEQDLPSFTERVHELVVTISNYIQLNTCLTQVPF